VPKSAGELLHRSKLDGELARLKGDVARGRIECGWNVVNLDKFAQAAAGPWFRSSGEKGSGIGALVDPVEECFQIGAGQEIALSHLRAGSNALNERLGAPGLQLKEPFDVLAFVMGANGVLHRATNFRESREPRNRAGHRKPLS